MTNSYDALREDGLYYGQSPSSTHREDLEASLQNLEVRRVYLRQTRTSRLLNVLAGTLYFALCVWMLGLYLGWWPFPL